MNSRVLLIALSLVGMAHAQDPDCEVLVKKSLSLNSNSLVTGSIRVIDPVSINLNSYARINGRRTGNPK